MTRPEQSVHFNTQTPDLPQAACKEAGPAAFYPVDRKDADASKRLCGGCPAVIACRAHGLEHEEWGTWGGLSEWDRREIRRQANLAERRAKRTDLAAATRERYGDPSGEAS